LDARTIGLILRTRPLTESSLIVHWLTPDLGRLSTVAKGARRSKSPFRGKLDLFYLADFSFVRSRRSELHTLREVSPQQTHPALRQHLPYLQQATYCALLIEQTTETETPLPGPFELLTGLLQHLPSRPAGPLAVLAFESKLLHELGLAPQSLPPELSSGSKNIFRKLADLDWASVACLKPSLLQSRELQQFLHGFLVYHLGKVPQGRTAAIEPTEP
jgi:DNA repair protein RecO (recombination protein O)